ncbi:hypothetical protein BDR26DRAFT_867233 [Obelidium mucronatum]|nr:hypothetical protein BDR26DRAFT_867233 [Obelidium mucronatum]
MPPGPPPPPPPGQPNVAVAAAEAKKRLEAKLAEKERKAAEQAAAQLAEEQAQAARWLNPAPLELVADEPTKLPASVIVNSEKYYVTEFLGGGSHGEVFAGCKASEVEGEIGTAEFAASLKSQNSNKAEYAIRYDKDNRPVEEHAKLAQQQIGHYRADEGRIQVQLNLSAKNMVSLKDYIGTHPGQVTKEWVKERMVESLQALERDFPGQTHGDFHPGNIMVDKDTGKVTCVIDFGDLEPGPHTFENSPWKDVPVSDVNREFRQIYLATNSANREARKSNAVEHSLKLQAEINFPIFKKNQNFFYQVIMTSARNQLIG